MYTTSKQEIQIYTTLLNKVGFVRVGEIPNRQKPELVRVGRAIVEPRKVHVDCLKLSWVSDFNHNHFSLRPSSAEGIGIDPSKDIWSFHLHNIIGCRYLLQADFPCNRTVPNNVISNVDILGGIVMNRIFR